MVYGVFECMGLSSIKKQTTHTIPPYGTPVFTTSGEVLTSVAMLHLGWLGGNHAAVLVLASYYVDVGSKNLWSKPQTVMFFKLRRWDIAKVGESTLKELPDVILDAEIDELGRMKGVRAC